MINGKISILKNYDGEPTFPITSSDAVMDGDASVKERIEDINRQLDDLKNNSDSNEYATKSELEEVFQSVSNGKLLIAEAITDKGVETSATDTFKVMAQNIEKIQGGENAPIKIEELISSGDYIKQTHTVGTKMNVKSIMSTKGVGLKDENGAYHLRYKVDNDVPKTDVRCDETIYDFTIPYPLVGDENVFNEIRKNKENGKFEYVRRVNSSNIDKPVFEVPSIPYSYNGCTSSNTVYIKERDTICIVGGWSTGSVVGQKSKTTSLYDFATDSWVKLADFPLSIGTPLVGYHDGKIYAFGGYTSSYSKTLYRLDLDNNVWENITSLVSPTSKLEGYGGSCVTYGDDIFLINFGRTSNDCYRYNVVDNTMTTITPPTSMTITSSGKPVIHNGILYAVSKNGALIKYDIANNIWEEIPRTDGKYFPRTSLAVVEDKIYAMGGDVRYKDRNYGKSFVCYDITNGTFHDLENIRLMYSNPCLFYRNNKIYSIGGYSYALNNPETSTTSTQYVPHHWYIYDLITEESYGYPVYDDLRVNDLIKIDNELVFTTNDRSNLVSYNLDTHIFKSITLTYTIAETRMVFYKDKIYCFGNNNNIRIVDWDNKTMISSKALPYSLKNNNLKPVLYDGMIYVNVSYSSSSNFILVYNPDDESIVEITCTVPLYNKTYLCATLCGNKIYYFGGGNKEVYAFSPRIKEFEKLADMPLSLNRAICVTFNELIYVMGGYTSSGVNNKIFIYDTKNDSWSESASIPNAMTGGAVVVDNYCYLASGTSQGSESSGYALYRGSVLYKLKLSEITPIAEEVIELDQDFDMLSKKHITGITSLAGETTMKVGIDVEVP